MHKIRIILLSFCFLCFSYFNQAFSQTISASPTEACAPTLPIQFNGITGANNILWTFGDGTFSNINNPTHAYTTANNFLVTYTAVVSGNPVTQTLTIKAHGKPTPNFSVSPTSGCVGTVMNFHDLSVSSGGTLTPTWQWSFGDGGVSNQQNPGYPYTLPGTFSVTLVYKDGYGCDSAITKPNLIKVSIKPTVVISNNPASLNACAAPFTATFSGSSSSSNSTTGSTALTYSWNLNGATSTSVNPPPITFTTTGSYPVSLTCTDNNNCSNSQTVMVNVLTPQLKALVQGTACLNQAFTVRDTSSASISQWNFGDGTPVQTVILPANFSHVYTSPGTFTISATTFLGNCSSSKTYTVYVEKVTADFTASPDFSCNSPMIVTFNNASIGGVSYNWSFNGVGTSTLTNPSYTLTQGSLNPFTVFQGQSLVTTLIATSAAGCVNTVTKTLDSLHRPTAFFYTDKIDGCVPLTVTFRDSSHSSRPITNYTWNFGDGSPVNAGTTNTLVTHTYTTPGVYYATLVIQNALGCRDTSFKWPIHVATPPHTSFSFSPSVVCPNEPVTITNLTPLADSVNHWHVTSDASYFSHCITDANPSWQYSHTGNHPITLTAYSFGCKHDTTLPSQVLVKGPIVSGRFYTRCDSVFKVKFNILLQDGDFAEINFDDGTVDTVYTSGNHTIYHTYATTGDYDVNLKGVNNSSGCVPSNEILKVKIRNIKSAITSQSIVCAGVPAAYSASTSQDVDAVCGVGYIWFFGNEPPVITDNASTNYALQPGTQTVSLVVKDENGCRDTSRTTVFASSVTVDAVLSNTIGCVPSFSLSATQNASSNSTITGYSWNFGDGSPAVTGTSATHTYTSNTANSYVVSLTVNNSDNCSNTKSYTVVMNAPQAPTISSNTTQICAGTTVSLTASSPAINTYTWNYGDGTTIATTATNTAHTFTTGGNYSVSITSADAAGCKATSNPYVIQVQSYPQASFSFTNPTNPTKHNACAGQTIKFYDNSVNPYSPITRTWDLGTGNPVVGLDSVGWTYTTPGTYTVSLINCTPFGCCDTYTQTIKVIYGTANFMLDKTTICKGEAIKFTIKDTTNVVSWLWDFGDGSVDHANGQSPVSHPYNFHPPGGSTNVSLVFFTADSACKLPGPVQTINIRQVIADFDRNNDVALSDTAHCIGTTDAFTNLSQNANTYSWNFGDGQTSGVQSPNHAYASSGTYTVSLMISDNVYNCKDTLRKLMQIFPVPQLVLTGKDTCQNIPVMITATGANTYTWSPATSLNNANSATPIATLSTTTIFSVTANNIEGCVGTNTLIVNISEPPLAISWDTSIVIGQTTPLPGTAGSNMSYSWTPTDYLTCITCPVPVASPTVDYIYSVTVKDAKGCYERVNTFTVHIDPKSSVDVPTAFTPNGDGVNDLINVDGWGIRKLKYFKVFNRWGELLFETSDLKSGWDGYYKGVPQNMETYIYQVEVETYTDSEPIKKTGYFKLLR